MVAEDKPARSPPNKRHDSSIQHHLNFLARLAGAEKRLTDDRRCPFHSRFIERHKMPNRQPQPSRQQPHRNQNSEEADDEPLMGAEAGGQEPEPDMGTAEPESELDMGEEEESDGEAGIQRHIHPCVCDLTKSQRRRIKTHLDHKALMRRKYNARIREIEEDLSRMEEERLEREREMEEQQELFGDEYELVGKKKKRKKRSARRASMVSLGVKQVINWRKEPKIKVKMSRASSLRKEYASYCGQRPIPETPCKQVSYTDGPHFKVRLTRAFSLRLKSGQQKLEYFLAHADKKPRFVLPYWV